jgi:fumarate hydratase, class II
MAESLRMAEYRIETDSMGEVRVEATRYWGAQTERARTHFPIGRERFVWRRPMIRALGRVKRAAALVNAALGVLPSELAALIARAAEEVIAGRLDEHFPLVVFQTGSGTQTNMNANEVIANRANELAGAARGAKAPVHPNDHVNRGQSTNDVFPTAMHVAAVEELRARLYPAVERLRGTLAAKRDAFAEVVKLGRTHLQDATPLFFGQEISGWVAQLEAALATIRDGERGLHALAIGGTAVGTGLNAHPEFGDRVAARLAAETGIPFAGASNKFAALAAHDAVVTCSATLRTLAGACHKIANDVRLLVSGPRGGLAEVRIPENEPGSSIMPGKVNPTQCEALSMVAVRVFGTDAAVAFAGSQGHLELNVYKPIMADGVLESIGLLADAIDAFDRYCAAGLEADVARMRAHVDRSLMLVTALAPVVGYDRAAAIAHKAHVEGLTLRDAALAMGALDAEEFDRLVDPSRMTRPG